MTITSSSLRMRAGISEHLRRERDDLHEVALAQLARDGAEDARPARVVRASMITAAFSSKPMYVPSSRPNDFFVRTTTAVTTSPS